MLLVACGGSSETKPDRVLAPCSAPHPVRTGQATHYDADGTGKCSFEASDDLLVAAMNSTDYERAAWCGACLIVTGPDDEIIVRVVDKCPGCKPGDLDLSHEAFAMLAPLSAGRIPITWLSVPCEVAGPIAYRFKARSNAYWTGIQLRNHRYPIASLEARDPAGNYRGITRADYNYFVTTKGLGPGPYTFRVTDTRGHILEDTGVVLGDAVARTGAAQFPFCP